MEHERVHEKLAYMRTKPNVISRDKKRQRTERKRHLIKCGELVEKYFGYTNIHPVELEKLLKHMMSLPMAKEKLERLIKRCCE